jgi:hypothetical protein
MAQTVERRIGSAEVTGSIPVSSLEKEVFGYHYGVDTSFFYAISFFIT